MIHLKPITKLEDIPQMRPETIKDLKEVTDIFSFRVPESYLKLIDWNKIRVFRRLPPKLNLSFANLIKY